MAAFTQERVAVMRETLERSPATRRMVRNAAFSAALRAGEGTPAIRVGGGEGTVGTAHASDLPPSENPESVRAALLPVLDQVARDDG